MLRLVEIFSSFQGEGIYVGQPTVFVRFGGCDLRCRLVRFAGNLGRPGRL